MAEQTVKVNLSRDAMFPTDESSVAEYRKGQGVEMPLPHALAFGYDEGNPDAPVGSVQQIRAYRERQQQEGQQWQKVTLPPANDSNGEQIDGAAEVPVDAPLLPEAPAEGAPEQDSGTTGKRGRGSK